MSIEKLLTSYIEKAVHALYNQTIDNKLITLQKTNKEFEGDYTLTVFAFTKFSKKSPEITAQEIGNYLKENLKEVKSFNVIKGFLNLVIDENFWLSLFNSKNTCEEPNKDKAPVLIEYSSPNTNKPLHLGHIRNNLLGFALAAILKEDSNHVVKVNLINDRGIHICKSMLAWMKWGNGETPEKSGLKGDHLVGKYYVLFDQHYKKEVAQLIEDGTPEEDALKKAPLIIEAQGLLKKWEAKDKETLATWKTMNSWVYEGFDKTYTSLGVDFDKVYYESDTYLLGKKIVEEGLQKKVFLKKDDGSIWVNLTDEGLDQKVLQRADGTSVYITQDLGTAQLRVDDFHPKKMIYVVGNEQNYHFDVLKKILKKLGKTWADQVFHMSYGMVELPEGKMKSREGTVVDADDLIEEMIETAKKTTEELGKAESITKEEAEKLYRQIGLGALKYFILKVDPKKNMLFNPKESIDFNGNTGPFIQYTYARIQSLLRKAGKQKNTPTTYSTILPKEKDLIKLLCDYHQIIKDASETYSPALVANYIYELAKEFNQFYQEVPILKAEKEEEIHFRLNLSSAAGEKIKKCLSLLGIEAPERM